jgi:hypothetical protein
MPFSPDMGPIGSVDQLGIDAHSVADFLDTAFQDIAYPQFLPDCFCIHSFSFVGENRATGDDQQIAKPGQVRDDVVGDPIAEILLLRIAAQVLEQQHGDGGGGRLKTRNIRRRLVGQVGDAGRPRNESTANAAMPAETRACGPGFFVVSARFSSVGSRLRAHRRYVLTGS